ADGVRSVGGALSIGGMLPPVSAAAQTSLVSTIRSRIWRKTLIRVIPRKDLHLVFQRTVKLFVVKRLREIEKTPGVPGLLAGENIKEVHGLIRSFRVWLTGVVMDSVGRMQVSVRHPHAAIQAR